MSFKGLEANMEGEVAISLPHGLVAKANLSVETDGTVCLRFVEPDFANEIIVSAFRSELLSLRLSYESMRTEGDDQI